MSQHFPTPQLVAGRLQRCRLYDIMCNGADLGGQRRHLNVPGAAGQSRSSSTRVSFVLKNLSFPPLRCPLWPFCWFEWNALGPSPFLWLHAFTLIPAASGGECIHLKDYNGFQEGWSVTTGHRCCVTVWGAGSQQWVASMGDSVRMLRSLA